MNSYPFTRKDSLQDVARSILEASKQTELSRQAKSTLADNGFKEDDGSGLRGDFARLKTQVWKTTDAKEKPIYIGILGPDDRDRGNTAGKEVSRPYFVSYGSKGGAYASEKSWLDTIDSIMASIPEYPLDEAKTETVIQIIDPNDSDLKNKARDMGVAWKSGGRNVVGKNVVDLSGPRDKVIKYLKFHYGLSGDAEYDLKNLHPELREDYIEESTKVENLSDLSDDEKARIEDILTRRDKNMPDGMKNRKRHPILMFDKNGQYHGSYASVSDAEEKIERVGDTEGWINGPRLVQVDESTELEEGAYSHSLHDDPLVKKVLAAPEGKERDKALQTLKKIRGNETYARMVRSLKALNQQHGVKEATVERDEPFEKIFKRVAKGETRSQNELVKKSDVVYKGRGGNAEDVFVGVGHDGVYFIVDTNGELKFSSHKDWFAQIKSAIKRNGNGFTEPELEEGVDKSSQIYKEYEELKKLPIKSLRNKLSLTHKIVDLNGYDKEGAISQILRDKHGDKKVDAAMGLEEDWG